MGSFEALWDLLLPTVINSVLVRNRLTDIEYRLVVAKEGGGGRMDWEFGTSRCKLL